MPLQAMDLLWYAQEHGAILEWPGEIMGLTTQQAQRAYREFEQKRRATTYLRSATLAL